MKASKRFVFDTNTLVSAAIFKTSIPALALQAAILTGELACSPETEGESIKVLSRDKLDRYLTLSERIAFVSAVMQYAVMIDKTPPLSACCDSKDDQFLSLAVCAEADAIVT